MASIAPLSEFNETNAELAAGIWPNTHSPLSCLRIQICSPTLTGDLPAQRIAFEESVIVSLLAKSNSAPFLPNAVTAAGMNGSESGNFFKKATMRSLSHGASPFFQSGALPRQP